MGGVLEQTPEMRPYFVEIRGEGFYLYTPELGRLVVDRPTWSIPAGDAPMVLAALEQVRGHLAEVAGADDDEDADGEFTVTARGDRLVVDGPGVLYANETVEAGAKTTVEIEYRHLDALYDALELEPV
ncbi:hypothetical protein GCM10022252_74980 [Streptosporangium oxazolinicum]|uniref:Uncharacterized protein n=1 Tax=Streptosporangium oxazolinicum TaxID=909287 RepID=A0ABP8BKA0_9ACTN